jgi:hypothetical protein
MIIGFDGNGALQSGKVAQGSSGSFLPDVLVVRWFR